MKITLTKIHRSREDGPRIPSGQLDGLRDDVVVGYRCHGPIVGEPFVLEAPPKQDGYAARVVWTSPVKSVIGDLFTTESGSVYEVKEEIDG